MKKLLLILSVAFTLAFTSCSADDSSQSLGTETTQKYFTLEDIDTTLGGFNGEPKLYINGDLKDNAISHSYPVKATDVVTVQLSDAGGDLKIIYSISKNGIRERDTISFTGAGPTTIHKEYILIK